MGRRTSTVTSSAPEDTMGHETHPQQPQEREGAASAPLDGGPSAENLEERTSDVEVLAPACEESPVYDPVSDQVARILAHKVPIYLGNGKVVEGKYPRLGRSDRQEPLGPKEPWDNIVSGIREMAKSLGSPSRS